MGQSQSQLSLEETPSGFLFKELEQPQSINVNYTSSDTYTQDTNNFESSQIEHFESSAYYSETSIDKEPDTPFNPDTGEINWDCPCLKGALDPPCGEAFKAAFSCFVASKSEPRGEDCLDKFILLQECFRLHPEIYDKKFSDSNDDEPKSDEFNDPLTPFMPDPIPQV